jgi:hypothetical protein
MRGASRGVLRWSGSMKCRRRAFGPKAGRVGAGDAALGPQIMPTNPHRWPKAGAFGLVWRPRAVPRTHGTRAATGLRPAGHYEPPARSSLTTGIAGESAARRRDKNATSGAPRGEHPSQLVCADCVNSSAVARDASRLTSVARRADRKAWHRCAFRRSAPLAFQGEHRRRRPAPKKIKTSGRRSVG